MVTLSGYHGRVFCSRSSDLLVDGAGLLAGVWTEFVRAVYEKGGCADDLHRLSRPEGRQTIDGMAELIIQSADPRFSFLKAFTVVVPADYHHPTQLQSFRSKYYKRFTYYNDNITDENFRQPSVILRPGQQFQVKVFGIKEDVVVDSKQDILPFLRGQGARFTGVQGLALAWDQKKAEFPLDKWALSFDEEEKLPVLDGYRRVPGARRDSGGDSRCNLGSFERDWYGNYVLLCFCDLPGLSA